MNINFFVLNFKMSLEIVETENSVSLYSYLVGNENNFNTIILLILIITIILLGFIPQLFRVVQSPTTASKQTTMPLCIVVKQWNV